MGEVVVKMLLNYCKTSDLFCFFSLPNLFPVSKYIRATCTVFDFYFTQQNTQLTKQKLNFKRSARRIKCRTSKHWNYICTYITSSISMLNVLNSNHFLYPLQNTFAATVKRNSMMSSSSRHSKVCVLMVCSWYILNSSLGLSSNRSNWLNFLPSEKVHLPRNAVDS